MPLNDKSDKRVKQLFSDIERITNGSLTADSERLESFADIARPASQVLSDNKELSREIEALNARVLELESLLNESKQRASAQEVRLAAEEAETRAAQSIIYEKEQVGYSYHDNDLSLRQMANFDLSKTENDINAPITASGKMIGEMQIQQPAERTWTAEDADLANAVAQQVSLQIQNLRLLADASRARADAEEATRRLSRESWQAYTQRAQTTLGYAYDSTQVMPLKETSNLDHANFSQPLTVRGETIGHLAVTNFDHISPEEAELAVSIAERVSAQLERLRLTEEIEKRAAELATVATLSTAASTVLNPDELLQQIVDLTKERFNLYHVHIYLADDSWKTLLLAAGAGEIGRQMVSEGWAIPINHEQSIVANAARNRRSIIANDLYHDKDSSFLSNRLLPETRSEMAVPMIAGDKLLGVFDVQADSDNFFSEEDANIYTTLAAQVAVALQNARLYVEQAATVAQLRELDRLKSSFLANMSHELRTPLNSILGFADVMLEGLDGPLTDNMDNDLGLIQKNGQHLLHLINDVLDMAKIESGKMNLNVEKFNLHELLTDVTSITSSLAKEKSIALVIEADSDRAVEINADKIRLRQVMINLVNNAMKFTEKGRISIRAVRQENHVLISVKDSGIGIPADHLETVFQEFTQVDTTTTRKAGGTGLGLPISRRLINMHSGHLWAESAGVNGEGSTFYVTLPIEANINENASLTAK